MELSAVMERLQAAADVAYRDFNESLIPGKEGTSLGVRVPQLRIIARDICQNDWRQFLAESQGNQLYELVMLRGLVIAGAVCEYPERLRLLRGFIPEIDNWGVCDCVTSTLKSAKKNLPETWEFLQPCLRSSKEYELRFAVVMLMDYFLIPAYIDRVLDIYANIRHDGYYVQMAVAWALSVCFVKFRDRTLSLLEQNALAPWTQNKTIQKCRGSRRVSDSDKEMLLQYKR